MSNDPPVEGSGQDSRLGDRYEIGGLLGRGGMADVRIGRDVRLGRTVAIKRLRSDLASDPVFQARFQREAHSAASLNHPAIVAVYDTGEETGPDGQRLPFIVMEYVEGKTLREVLREGRKILPERALGITADVLSALDYSHRAGIVHRDIKPANVMLTPSGQVKVMDFGIARALADASSTMTQTAAVVGTAQYLSPEQARGEQVDARSDIYSTGCLLFELLCERPPFIGDSPVSVAYQHVREEPPTPSSMNTEVTDEMDAVIAKALAKRTEDRYQSAAEMRADIERILAGQPVEAPTAMLGATSVVPAVVTIEDDAVATSFFPSATDAEDSGRRRTWLWVALLLLLVAAAVAAALLLPKLLGGNGPEPDVSVPGVIGLSQQQAETQIEDAGLTVGDVSTDSSEVSEKGKVISQDPAEGDFLFADDPVNLVVGGGPNQVQVPFLIGLKKPEAIDKLDEANLKANFEFDDSDQPQGRVLRTDPNATEMVSPNSTVTVVLSNGPIIVPDVVDLTEDVARAEILDAGLEPRSVSDSNSSADAGTVIAQTPGGGDQVSEGSEVIITVSNKPDETTPPPTTTEPPTTTTTPPPTTPPTTAPTTTAPTTIPTTPTASPSSGVRPSPRE